MRTLIPLLHDALGESASRLGDKVALVCGRERLTYREIEARANALAHALRAQGVARGDRVLVFGGNTAETALAFWAALKADAVPCIVGPLTRSEKLRELVEDCRPAALVTEARLREAWHEAARSRHLRSLIVSGPLEEGAASPAGELLRWDDALAWGERGRAPARHNIDIDLAAIIYTSGSTGESKGVMLTHRNMLAACASIVTLLELQADDVILSALPLAFNYGLYQMIMAFRQGARLVLEPSFTYPARVLRRMAEEGVTGFPGVPTVFSVLGELRTPARLDLSCVRYVTNTAGALERKHIRTLQALFPRARIFSMYGLTECKRCTWLPPQDLERKPGSVGFAIPNTEMWIVDEHDREVPPGTVGQLVIRGATVMQGYWERPEATARALRPGRLPGERVLYTGDLCRIDEEGYLTFIGRMDDMIKSRGVSIAPQEIETALLGMPGIREAAVIGVPDARLGQALKAFVVRERGAALDALEVQRRCRGALAAHLVPKYVELVAELPRTDTGKINKLALSRQPAAPASLPETATDG